MMRTRSLVSNRASILRLFGHQGDDKALAKEEIIRLRKKHLSPSLNALYRDPVNIVRGKGQYVWDDAGKKYLDGFAGVATVSVGHAHPKITAAVHDQLQKVVHTTHLYLNEEVVKYAAELAKRMPGNLSVCHFVNSGSEANDLALMMARLATGNTDIIALRNCYHGMSPFVMGVTAHSTWKYPVAQGQGVHHALNPDRYRGPFGYDDPLAAKKYAWDVKNLVDHATTGKVAAFIAEPIQGVGGAIELPEGYLPEVYNFIRSKGGVVIADEVQTGFGRTGTHYWGFENHGVVPDIVTMAKGIGNGWPLAAVVTTPEIAEAMKQKLWFNTFGGNPVSSVVGRTVLQIIDEEGIVKNADKVGTRLKKGLTDLTKKYPRFLADARGKGLMLGVEVISDPVQKTPNTPGAVEILEGAKEKGLLIGKGGFYGNVLRIKPVMTMTESDADFTLNVLNDVVAKLAK